MVITCKDGFEMGANNKFEVSGYEYCDANSMEVGWTSDPEPLLDRYMPDDDVVWKYVPHSVIEEIVEKHGGRV